MIVNNEFIVYWLKLETVGESLHFNLCRIKRALPFIFTSKCEPKPAMETQLVRAVKVNEAAEYSNFTN